MGKESNKIKIIKIIILIFFVIIVGVFCLVKCIGDKNNASNDNPETTESNGDIEPISTAITEIGVSSTETNDMEIITTEEILDVNTAEYTTEENANNFQNPEGELEGNTVEETSSATTEQITELTTEQVYYEDTQHQHTWEAQYMTVHHEEEGHCEDVLVQEAYDESVYETHEFCNYCNIDITAAGEDASIHCLFCGPPMSPDNPFYEPGATDGSSWGCRNVKVDTIHHDAVYETQWIVDKEAYDEQVLTGYICTCGETKSN